MAKYHVTLTYFHNRVFEVDSEDDWLTVSEDVQAAPQNYAVITEFTELEPELYSQVRVDDVE